MHLDHAAEPVVIGDAERAVPELGGPFHKPQRVRSPVEEAVVGMGVELCVPCHALSVIERTFDRKVVGRQSPARPQLALLVAGSDQNRLVDIEPTIEELARLRRKATVRKVIVILVVVAMIAALLVPVIVRVVRAPPEPERILAAQTPIASRRMSP